jgi:hypothetical protein
MLKALFVILVLGLGAWVISQMLPDIQRYLRMRSM